MKYKDLVYELVDIWNDQIKIYKNAYNYGEFIISEVERPTFSQINLWYMDKLRDKRNLIISVDYKVLDDSSYKHLYLNMIKHASFAVTCDYNMSDGFLKRYYSIRDLVYRGLYIDEIDSYNGVMTTREELLYFDNKKFKNNIEIV